jgi:hypothetical protein
MGHYAYLDSLDPIDRVLAARTPELEAKYAVPIFWLAMFDVSDIREEPLTGMRYADKEALFVLQPPYLVVDMTTALARLTKRSPALARLTGEGHVLMARKWKAFARRIKPSMLMRFDGVDAAFTQKLRGALALVAQLDSPDAAPEDYLVEPLVSVWSGPNWRESEHVESLLAGWGWQVSSEERSARARDRKWQKAVGDRAETEMIAYTVNRTFTADELLRHPTLGEGVVTRVIDANKIEVLFREGPRTLIHGRTARP